MSPPAGDGTLTGFGSGGEIGALVDLAALADTVHAAMVALTARIQDGMLAQRRAGLPLTDVLTMETRLTLGEQRGLMRTAAGLERLPALGSAMRAGVVGAGEVRAILSEARGLKGPAREQLDLLFEDHAALTGRDVASVLDDVAAKVVQLDDRPADDQRVKTFERRFLAVQPGLDGTLSGYFEIDDTCGAIVLRALDDAAVPLTGPRALTRDAVHTADDQDGQDARAGLEAERLVDRRTLGRRRADALVSLAEHWLAGHDEPPSADRCSAEPAAAPAAEGGAVEPVASDGVAPPGRGGRRRRGMPRRARPLIYVWTDIGTLAGDDASGGAARLLWDTLGPRPVLTAAAVRRLASDATLQFVLADGGEVLGVAAPTATIPAKVRAAVHARDHGCRFPGCRVPARQTDLHHVIPREDAGPTLVENLVALCRRHHTAVTEARWRLTMDADGVVTVRRGRHVARSDPPSLDRSRHSEPSYRAGRPRGPGDDTPRRATP